MKENCKSNTNFYNCPFICTAKHNIYDNNEQILMKCAIGLPISLSNREQPRILLFMHISISDVMKKNIEKTDKCSAKVVEKW
jgi:hypothetical protein